MDTLAQAPFYRTSDLRHSDTVPNAGRKSGCYRPNHFYESLPESSYNPIKLIMFCYLLKARGTGYREATQLIGLP